MTLITSPKPDTELVIHNPGLWVTVAVSKFPAGSEVHAMLYANVYGTGTPGDVIQLDVRALRNGYTESHPDFDETALSTHTAVVKANGTWRARITATWFGARAMSTLHWQIQHTATHGATVKGSRYAKGMTN